MAGSPGSLDKCEMNYMTNSPLTYSSIFLLYYLIMAKYLVYLFMAAGVFFPARHFSESSAQKALLSAELNFT